MKTLIWDIETAPTKAFVWGLWKNNVGLNQIVEPGRILCWAAKWLGDDEPVYYSNEWSDGQDRMIRELHDLLSEADANITYNGDHFDLPVLNSSFLKLGLAPHAESKSIDLYQVVKRRFRMLSNRLDYVCSFLGLEGKHETGGFQLWVDVLDGVAEAQEKFQDYNVNDVVILEALYERLRPWIRNPPQAGHFVLGDHVCPSCGSPHVQRRGVHRTKVFEYQRYQCVECGAWSRERLRDKTGNVNNLVSV